MKPKRSTTQNTTPKLHECQVCHKEFSKKGLVNHFAETHPEMKKKAPTLGTSCLWEKNGLRCSYVAEDAAGLTNHIVSVHKEGLSNNKCFWKDCDRELKPLLSGQNFLGHIRIHTNDRPFECEHCSKTFVLEKNLTEHLWINHPEEALKALKEHKQPSFCKWKKDGNECDFVGATSLDLTRHILKDHSRETKEYMCHWECCGKSIRLKNDFIKHFRGRHNKEDRPYPCALCHLKFTLKKELDYHMRQFHPGETSEIKCYWMKTDCLTCGSTCQNPTKLAEHIRAEHHTEQFGSFVCDWDSCWMEFEGYPDFISHLASHTEEQSLECDICHEKFARNGLKYHRDTAHKEMMQPKRLTSQKTKPAPHPPKTSCLDLSSHDLSCQWATNGQVCMHKSENSMELRTHVESVHVTQKTEISCSWGECANDDFKFKQRKYFMAHLSSQHIEKEKKATPGKKRKPLKKGGPLELHCLWEEDGKGCSFVGDDQADLTEHIYITHKEGTGNFVCHWKNCSLGLQSIELEKEILVHVRTHTGDRPFGCSRCPDAFISKEGLQRHMKRCVHTRENSILNKTSDLPNGTRKRGRRPVSDESEDDERPTKTYLPATAATDYSRDHHQTLHANYQYIDDYMATPQPTNSTAPQHRNYAVDEPQYDEAYYWNHEDQEGNQQAVKDVLYDQDDNEPVYMNLEYMPGPSNRDDLYQQDDIGFEYERL